MQIKDTLQPQIRSGAMNGKLSTAVTLDTQKINLKKTIYMLKSSRTMAMQGPTTQAVLH